jgi:serine/threonine protein kinase
MLQPARAPGQLVADRYRLARHLGQGSMGDVYEAKNEWTRRKVAIKFLRPELGSDPEGVRRFLREAQSAARVGHPHIVEILDAGRAADDGTLYIVQEFLTGETLRDRLNRAGILPVEEALRIALPLLDALCAAHRLGVVHRDIKPENIFIVENPNGQRQPKLIDFGFAKVRRRGRRAEETLTRGDAPGTPRYMAPEQFSGERGLDARVDVWAMGVVLFEMISSRYPHEAVQLFELMNQVQHQPARPLCEVAPGCPADVAAVVGRALEADRERRFPSVSTFLAALLGCAASEPLATHPFVAFNPHVVDETVAGRSFPELPEGDGWDEGESSMSEESVTSVPALIDGGSGGVASMRRSSPHLMAPISLPEISPTPVPLVGVLQEAAAVGAAGAGAAAPGALGRTGKQPRVREPPRKRRGEGLALWPHGVLAILLALIAVLLVLLATKK